MIRRVLERLGAPILLRFQRARRGDLDEDVHNGFVARSMLRRVCEGHSFGRAMALYPYGCPHFRYTEGFTADLKLGGILFVSLGFNRTLLPRNTAVRGADLARKQGRQGAFE